MNDSNTTTIHNVEEDQQGNNSTLVVTVAVLGTLVGVAVGVSCVWGCFVYCRHVGWTTSGGLRKRGGGSNNNSTNSCFPPSHRNAVEMTALPTSTLITPSTHNHSSTPANTNHSGVSRGLGLVESVIGQELPAPPPPRSWTPSPPFQPNEAQNQPFQPNEAQNPPFQPNEAQNPPFQPNKAQNPPFQPNGTQNSAARGWRETQQSQTQITNRSGVATYSSRGRNSPYNPRFNTPNTNQDTSSHSPQSNSSVYLPLVLRRLPGEPHPHYTTINPYWLELPSSHRQPRKTRRARTRSRTGRHTEARPDHGNLRDWKISWCRSPHIYFKDTHERDVTSGDQGMSDDDEVPAACSSQHGSPPLPPAPPPPPPSVTVAACPSSSYNHYPSLPSRPGPSHYPGFHSLNLSHRHLYGSTSSWSRRYLGPGAHYYQQQQQQQQQQQYPRYLQHLQQKQQHHQHHYHKQQQHPHYLHPKQHQQHQQYSHHNHQHQRRPHHQHHPQQQQQQQQHPHPYHHHHKPRHGHQHSPPPPPPLPHQRHRQESRKRWPRPDTPAGPLWWRRDVPLTEEEEEEEEEEEVEVEVEGEDVEEEGEGERVLPSYLPNPQHQLVPITPRSSRPQRQMRRRYSEAVGGVRPISSPPIALPRRAHPPPHPHPHPHIQTSIPPRLHLPTPPHPPKETRREEGKLKINRRKEGKLNVNRRPDRCGNCGDKTHNKRVLWRREEKRSKSTQTVPCLDSATTTTSSSVTDYSSSPEDPTPSLSWDNLTPDPSPALPLQHNNNNHEQQQRHQHHQRTMAPEEKKKEKEEVEEGKRYVQQREGEEEEEVEEGKRYVQQREGEEEEEEEGGEGEDEDDKQVEEEGESDHQEVGEGNDTTDNNIDARTDSTLPSWAASYGLVYRDKTTLVFVNWRSKPSVLSSDFGNFYSGETLY
ncbi:hypothetical protein Pmani_028346 [Petrolisthes manimaculis]|uniref:Uncharacterized protein n=1 Tax=Petrolisthes manimaculis TaxID=1843537 RepID=A0AAE1P1B5_9EUCA|nr:hypothetical protein Pmani_028346 [Petrolisthes manimaculis]